MKKYPDLQNRIDRTRNYFSSERTFDYYTNKRRVGREQDRFQFVRYPTLKKKPVQNISGWTDHDKTKEKRNLRIRDTTKTNHFARTTRITRGSK